MEPWQIVEGIEYRSATYLAYKAPGISDLDKNQAVIYLGPFHSITDDSGTVYRRGERTAVSAKTFDLLMVEPYTDLFAYIEPSIAVTTDIDFTVSTPKKRDPKDTKKGAAKLTTDPSQSSSCC
ncbi:MAG: hypothetical protein JKX72_10460 [Robiginitomaculum sp.]|nr:hypothetical protein [Robiginitomaculum sp.]